jgi:hypothetical protein
MVVNNLDGFFDLLVLEALLGVVRTRLGTDGVDVASDRLASNVADGVLVAADVVAAVV